MESLGLQRTPSQIQEEEKSEELLTPEIKAELDPLIQSDVDQILTWGPEILAQAAEFDATRQRGKGREQARQEFRRIFDEADVDKDELLNLGEFMDAHERFKAAKVARGEPDTDRSDAQTQTYYNAINKISPENDGVNLLDLAIALFYYQNTLKERMMTEKQK